MINEKRLVANTAGLLGNSSQSKKMATGFKRLAGGIKNIRTFDLELSAAEQKTLDDAVSVLSAAANVYRKAMSIQLKNEKIRKDNFERTLALVKSSNFGQLNTLEDKFLLVATTTPYVINDIADSAYSAQYVATRFFGESLEYIARRLADETEHFQQELDAAWQRFLEKRPGLLQAHGEKIRRAIELIDAEVAKSVNRV